MLENKEPPTPAWFCSHHLIQNYPWYPVFSLAVLIWRQSGHRSAAWMEPDTKEAPRVLPLRCHCGTCWGWVPEPPPPPSAGSCWNGTWRHSCCFCLAPSHPPPTPWDAPQILLSIRLFCRGLSGPLGRIYQKSGILSMRSKRGEYEGYFRLCLQVRKVT